MVSVVATYENEPEPIDAPDAPARSPLRIAVRGLLIVALTYLLAPVGIWFIWARTHLRPSRRKLATVAAALWLPLWCVAIWIAITSDPEADRAARPEAPAPETQTTELAATTSGHQAPEPGLDSATLGGLRSAWDDTYALALPGVENSPTYEPCDGNPETFQYSVSFDPAAYFISYGSCSGIGPSDLNFTTDLGEPARSYMSNELAGVILRQGDLGALTQDCGGTPLPPGTFFLVAEQTGWTISLGTCP